MYNLTGDTPATITRPIAPLAIGSCAITNPPASASVGVRSVIDGSFLNSSALSVGLMTIDRTPIGAKRSTSAPVPFFAHRQPAGRSSSPPGVNCKDPRFAAASSAARFMRWNVSAVGIITGVLGCAMFSDTQVGKVARFVNALYVRL